MATPDDPNDRIRKAREEQARRYASQRQPIGKPFIPFRTMFKLKSHLHPQNARQLECLSCGMELEWRIYTVAPQRFDTQCPGCGVTAKDYWSGRVSREVKEPTDGIADEED